MRHPVVEEDLDRIAQAHLNWEVLEGQRVLVSGANGFLPAYMIETLLRLNETRFRRPVHVIGLARNAERAAARFHHYQGRRDLQLLIQDVCAPVHIEERVDFVVHAASQASPKHYGKDPMGSALPNTLGTWNLLNLAREHHSQGFLFFSSGEVYGLVDALQMPITETTFGPSDPMAARWCYAESKRAGEMLCACAARQDGVPTKIIRLFHTYGPGMRLDDGRVFADFVADVLAGRDISVRNGAVMRTFCYLADAVRAFFTVLLRGVSGEAYNVANNECETSILDLAHLLACLLPEKHLRVIEAAVPPPAGYLESVIRRALPATDKLRGLGWAPHTPLREGFARTIASFG